MELSGTRQCGNGIGEKDDGLRTNLNSFVGGHDLFSEKIKCIYYISGIILVVLYALSSHFALITSLLV